MKKILGIMMALVLMAGALTVPAFTGSASAKADSVYIIPDSDTRQLTEKELWGYRYDTLMFAFNEIYARHGYKFETGSRCYNWFTQMPWYTPNESENSRNHHECYSKCSQLENRNVDLIKKVRKDMKAQGTTNPTGKGMPTPPSRNLDNIRGFRAINLKANQKLPVYSAPFEGSFRAANGKAVVSTNGAVYAMGWENDWLLVMYETNKGQCRIGYVNGSGIRSYVPALEEMSFAYTSCEVMKSAGLTDDPAKTGKALAQLPAGTKVTYLTTMYNSGSWDYIETSVDGQTARGFVPGGTLDIDEFSVPDTLGGTETDEAVG